MNSHNSSLKSQNSYYHFQIESFIAGATRGSSTCLRGSLFKSDESFGLNCQPTFYQQHPLVLVPKDGCVKIFDLITQFNAKHNRARNHYK